MLTIQSQYTQTQEVTRMDAMLAIVLQPNRDALIRFVRNYNKLKLKALPNLLSSDDVDELMNIISDYKADLILEQEASWHGTDPEREFIDNRDIIDELDKAYERLYIRN